MVLPAAIGACPPSTLIHVGGKSYERTRCPRLLGWADCQLCFRAAPHFLVGGFNGGPLFAGSAPHRPFGHRSRNRQARGFASTFGPVGVAGWSIGMYSSGIGARNIRTIAIPKGPYRTASFGSLANRISRETRRRQLRPFCRLTTTRLGRNQKQLEMKMRRYRLTCRNRHRHGPVFGPLYAEEQGLVHDAGREYLLLRLDNPIETKDLRVKYVLVSPRYVGDTLEKLQQTECVVAVWRVSGGKRRLLDKGLSQHAEYWAAGTSQPCTAA